MGFIGGGLVGLVITWNRRGFGLVRNLTLGVVGALVGGYLFRLFGLFPGLDNFLISLRDVVSAFLGSLLVLAALWLRRRSTAK